MTSSRSPSTVEVAATAAQAVRELTHRTLSLPALRGPAELDRLVAELAVMTDTLPQLLRQLSGWLGTQQHAGRLRSDNHTDPRALVDRATADLTNAEHAARQLSQALDNAHQHTAHLSASSAATPSPPPADHARPPTPTGQESWPPAGSFMATSGQVFCPQVGRNRCPLTATNQYGLLISRTSSRPSLTRRAPSIPFAGDRIPQFPNRWSPLVMATW